MKQREKEVIKKDAKIKRVTFNANTILGSFQCTKRISCLVKKKVITKRTNKVRIKDTNRL